MFRTSRSHANRRPHRRSRADELREPVLAAAVPRVRQVRLLAISGTSVRRWRRMLTLAKAGWGAWEIVAWYGLCAPAGTPRR
jgi:hypothetical protein